MCAARRRVAMAEEERMMKEPFMLPTSEGEQDCVAAR